MQIDATERSYKVAADVEPADGAAVERVPTTGFSVFLATPARIQVDYVEHTRICGDHGMELTPTITVLVILEVPGMPDVRRAYTEPGTGFGELPDWAAQFVAAHRPEWFG